MMAATVSGQNVAQLRREGHGCALGSVATGCANTSF